MTLDDLRLLYNDAYHQGYNPAAYHLDKEDLKAQRAGIRAVVEALRGEIFDARGNASYGSLAIFDLFNEILGARFAEDKAAGGSARKGERADGGDLVLSNTTESLKAPAAAPVCEWTKSPLRLYEHSASILYRTGCGADFFYNHKQCQGCGLPISIKSEAAR